MNRRIIGLGGRCRSGKGSLADICEKHGYKRLYFAMPLKNMCADFLNVSLEELDRLKNENVGLEINFDESTIDFFSKETEIPKETVYKVMNGKLVHNIRELLQFVGTDLIRAYNMNWHVNKIRAMIEDNEKYVIEDVRFPNEKEMIEDIGGDNWFVVRPKIDNISHHISEESLRWQDFGDKVIINNNSIEYLEMMWENFLLNYDKSIQVREKCIVDISLHGFGKCDSDEPFNLLASLFISPYFFSYKEKRIDKDKVKSITLKSNSEMVIEYEGCYEIIANPLIIEDIKTII